MDYEELFQRLFKEKDMKERILQTGYSYVDAMFGDDTLTYEKLISFINKYKNELIECALNDNILIENLLYEDGVVDTTKKSLITKEYLEEGKTVLDIHYISMLDDNITCKKEGADYYLGQTVEEIGIGKNNSIDSHTKLFLIILAVVGGFLLFIFLYSFMFTNTYENMDGDDLRTGYKKYNKELSDERERELRIHPPKPKEVKKTKTDEVLAQEEKAANENKEGTDLHNFYK